MSAHAFLPPSGAHTWSKCAMWPFMNQKFPQEESEEAGQGTAAHWTAWEIYAGRSIQAGMKAPNGMLVTEEMLEGGDLLSDTIHVQMPGWNPISIEKQIPIPFGAGNFGTPDAWGAVMVGKGAHIAIVDYKFGHRFVDEFFNPQGLCHLAGILNALKIKGHLDTIVTVSFTVVQPRCFYKGAPVRTHTFTVAEARPYFNKLSMMADAANMKEPTATTNDHCGDCPGRHSCSALQLAAYADAEYSTARTPLFLSPAGAALELRFLTRAMERLEARVDGLKELTISNIRKGERVPYYKVEPGFGRQTWTGSDAQVIALGSLFGVDLSKAGTVTPTQAKKAGIPEAIVKANSFTPSTALKLVAENPTDAPRVFGNI